MKILLALLIALFAVNARAMPSMDVWIPSVDAQSFDTYHLNYNSWTWPGKPTTLLLGPTFGVSPSSKVQVEVGFDLMLQGRMDLDSNPLYLNGKVATPEDAFFKFQPALAIGVYSIGTSRITNQEMAYGIIGRTLPMIGRLSVGYFYGNPISLTDQYGRPANQGLLASWGRNVGDRLWLGLDYQGSQSSVAAVSAGVTWKFTPEYSIMFGYDRWLNPAVALSGKQTVTVQFTSNTELFTHK